MSECASLSTDPKISKMRKIIITLAALFCAFTSAPAQSFLDHLQKDDKGNGSVSVKQSDDINKLVNGSNKNNSQTPQTDPSKPAKDKNKTDNKSVRPEDHSSSSSNTRREDYEREASAAKKDRGVEKSPSEDARERERREKERKAQREAERQRKIKEMEANAVPSDNSKKLMVNSKKVSGYRIQVYAGSNTRNDRAKAQEVCQKLKKEVPGQPIYVHFYSPRWVCRFGNFKKKDDAENMLKRVKKLGYKTACVVKCPISVSLKSSRL